MCVMIILYSISTVADTSSGHFQVLSKGEYRAEPADIWSCGIVLVAMLAGGNVNIQNN